MSCTWNYVYSRSTTPGNLASTDVEKSVTEVSLINPKQISIDEPEFLQLLNNHHIVDGKYIMDRNGNFVSYTNDVPSFRMISRKYNRIHVNDMFSEARIRADPKRKNFKCSTAPFSPQTKNSYDRRRFTDVGIPKLNLFDFKNTSLFTVNKLDRSVRGTTSIHTTEYSTTVLPTILVHMILIPEYGTLLNQINTASCVSTTIISPTDFSDTRRFNSSLIPMNNLWTKTLYDEGPDSPNTAQTQITERFTTVPAGCADRKIHTENKRLDHEKYENKYFMVKKIPQVIRKWVSQNIPKKQSSTTKMSTVHTYGVRTTAINENPSADDRGFGYASVQNFERCNGDKQWSTDNTRLRTDGWHKISANRRNPVQTRFTNRNKNLLLPTTGTFEVENLKMTTRPTSNSTKNIHLVFDSAFKNWLENVTQNVDNNRTKTNNISTTSVDPGNPRKLVIWKKRKRITRRKQRRRPL